MVFDIVRREVEGIEILDLSGRLVLGDAATELRNALKERIDAGTTQVVLNLAEVEYIDSTGLGTMVMSATTIRKAGGNLKLLNLNRRNIELMIMTKLTTIFEIFNDETDAVNSFFPDRKIKKFDILSFVQEQQKKENQTK